MPGVDSAWNPYRLWEGEDAVRDDLARATGTALIWRGLELAGDKVIFLVRMLILARLLSPDDFGLLAIAMTAIGFLLSVTDFGMLPALVQQRKLDVEQYDIAWTVIVTRAAMVGGVVFVSAPLIAGIFDEPRATRILQALAIRPLLEAGASIKMADLMRDLKFRPMTVAKLSEGVLNTIVAILLAGRYGVWALVFGALVGAVGYLIVSYMLAPHLPRLFFDFKSMRPLIRFGRWIFFSGLIAVCGGMILKIVISRELGAVQLGLYFLAARLAFLPAEVATKVAGHVAFPLYARLQADRGQSERAFRAMLTGMSALLLPICLMIIVLAPSFVEHVLGPRWAGTAPVIQILTLVSVVGMLGEATGPIFKGLGQPHKVTVIEAVQSFLIVAFVWGLANRYGLVGAVLAWFPAIGVSQVISVVFIRKMLHRPFSGLLGPMTAVAAASIAGATIAFIVDQLVPGLPGLGFAVISGGLCFSALILALDGRFGLGFRENLGKAFPQIAAFKGWKLGSSKVKAQS
jgi:O-antigen/teichoic acid export membrane protein